VCVILDESEPTQTKVYATKSTWLPIRKPGAVGDKLSAPVKLAPEAPFKEPSNEQFLVLIGLIYGLTVTAKQCLKDPPQPH
jgi:hypothetical protein